MKNILATYNAKIIFGRKVRQFIVSWSNYQNIKLKVECSRLKINGEENKYICTTKVLCIGLVFFIHKRMT